MTIIKIQKHEKYCVLENSVIEDIRLSSKYLGVFVRLISKRHDWKISIAGLATLYPTEGVDYYRAAMKELCKFGYLIRIPQPKIKGQFQKVEMHLFEECQLDEPLSDENVKKLFGKDPLENGEIQKIYPKRIFQHGQAEEVDPRQPITNKPITDNLIDRYDCEPSATDLKNKSVEEKEETQQEIDRDLDRSTIHKNTDRKLYFKHRNNSAGIIPMNIKEIFDKYLKLNYLESTIIDAICKMHEQDPTLSGTVDAYFSKVIVTTANENKKHKGKNNGRYNGKSNPLQGNNNNTFDASEYATRCEKQFNERGHNRVFEKLFMS